MDDKKPVLLTLHEALRLDLIEAYVAREITLAEVAESMELTRRQCSRLIKRYCELGPAGLVSRRRGKPGNHQLNTTIRDQALQLIRSRGRGMNPTAIWRILTTEYSVRISKERWPDATRSLWRQRPSFRGATHPIPGFFPARPYFSLLTIV